MVRSAFAGLVLDTNRYALRREDEVVHLEPQVFDVLAYLVERRDELVTKADLLDAVWGDRFVSEVGNHVADQSRAEGGRRQRNRGTGDPNRARTRLLLHRASGSPRRRRDDPATSPTRPGDPLLHDGRRNPSRLRHDGSWGSPLVRAADWMTHVDYDLRSPVWRHWLTSCRARNMFVATTSGVAAESGRRRDQLLPRRMGAGPRGGCRRRRARAVRPPRRVAGGAVSIAYAARHPERVTKLVLLQCLRTRADGTSRRIAERAEAELQAQMAVVAGGDATDRPTGTSSCRSSFRKEVSTSGTHSPSSSGGRRPRRTRSAT